MTARQARAKIRPGPVLVFGESENDCRAIAQLVVALRFDLAGTVQPRRRPLVLIKNVSPEKIPKRVAALADVVLAESVRSPVRAVIVHEDCDDPEPAHVRASKKIEDALKRLPCSAHAATPAFEIETWWMQWPKAGPLVCEAWRETVGYRGKYVGRIRNAKEHLRKALARRADKSKKRPREYEENDSPEFARVVKERNWAAAPEARSDSYDRFRQMCARL